jgi:diaminopimelate epimerase
MRTVAFEKYEGLGNDFVVVDLPKTALSIDEVIAICDRHRGVGADGVLFVGEDAPAMRVVNADGSTAEMCGNGLRCVAFHLARRARSAGSLETAAMQIDTDAGSHRAHVLSVEGATALVSVSMRPASLLPDEIPVRADAPLIDQPMRVRDREVRVTAVSMGNPHAVLFDDVGDARFALGPAIQDDARFPKKANVGFARMHENADRAAMTLHVYERGAGWTEACGTGACAAAVAAIETGRAKRGERIDVHLPGGVLEIVVGAREDRIQMTGPARHVFSGTVSI